MEIQTFTTPAIRKQVRTVLRDGEVLFVAKDIAEALDYTWDGHRIKHVPEEWRGMASVTTPSGTQEMAVLTEQGLYFFLGRSDKPKALPFQKWVAGEVIPQIRRTGAYQPQQVTRLEMARMLLEAEERAEQQARELEAARPAVEFHERVAQADGEMGIRLTAKMIQVKEPDLVRFLLSRGYVYRLAGKLHPSHYPMDRGYMRVRMREGGGEARPEAVFTPVGIEWISKRMREAA